MSRHAIKAKAPNLEVHVGWDRPMRTFFGQVHRTDAPDDEDDLVFWAGGKFDEIKKVAQLVSLMQPYADLSQETIDVLAADQQTGAMDESQRDLR